MTSSIHPIYHAEGSLGPCTWSSICPNLARYRTGFNGNQRCPQHVPRVGGNTEAMLAAGRNPHAVCIATGWVGSELPEEDYNT